MDHNPEAALSQLTDPPVATIPSETPDQASTEVHVRLAAMSLSGQKTSVENIDNDRYDALRLRNSLLPFHRLPPEVHGNILYHSLIDASDWDEHYEQLHTYAQVAYLWKSVVLNTPILWTRISSDMDPQFFAIALARSGDCPLDVKITGSSEDADKFLSLIIQTVQRWGSIVLGWSAEEDSEPLQSTLEQPMPHLRSATVFWEAPSSPVNLGAGQAGSLKDLALAGLTVPWDSSVLLGLKSLELGLLALTWSELHNLLQNAVHLESLRTVYVEISDLSIASRPSAPIILPSFRSLTLRKKVAPFLLRNILEAFHFPNLETCDIKLNMKENPLRDIFTPATDHMLPVFGAIIDTADEVSIRQDHYECEIRTTIASTDDDSDPKEILRLQADNLADRQEWPRWIASMLKGRRSSGVSAAESALAGSPTTDSSSALHNGPESGLKLKLECSNIDPLIERLIPSSGTPADAIEGWPLPRLQELLIRGDSFTPDCLLAMVRARCGRGGAGSTEFGRMPVPLDRLVLEYVGNIHDNIKKEIVQLLGPEKFACTSK